jgi:hypothetical protein
MMLYFGDQLKPVLFFFLEIFCNLAREKKRWWWYKGIFLGEKMGPSCHIMKEEQI